MKRNIHIILVLALLALPHACVRVLDGGEDPVTPNEDDCISFRMRTKAGSSADTTYRALLHNNTINGTDTLRYPYLNNSGTYRSYEAGDTTWLAACSVDPTTGAWLSDGHIGGLRAGRGTYKISFVSPAKAPVRYDTTSISPLKYHWGYHLRRDDPNNFYISTPVTMYLAGNHLGNKLVYDVSDTTILRERRAKIKLVLKCGNKLASAEVYKVGWTNLYTEAWFNIGRDSLERFTIQNPTDTIFCLNQTTPLVLSHSPGPESVVVADGFYIFALDYAKEDQDHKKAYSAIPKLHLMTVGSKVLTIEVAQAFLPQYEYTFNVNINTAFIQVDVSASPWVDGGNHSGAVSDADTFITSFSWTYPGAWQNGGGENGTIDSE